MEIQPNMRTCKVCGELWPYSDDIAQSHYFVVKRKNGKNYFSHTCKVCTMQKRKEYMKKYHEVRYVKKKHIPPDHNQVENIMNIM